MTPRIALVALALGGCSAEAPLPADPGARFDPVAFFAGRSHGDAVLRVAFSDPVWVKVDSAGRRTGGGGLSLDQSIREGDKPARKRRWVMRPAGTGQFAGTLTDADGPVAIAVAGPRATIAYRMKNGLEVRQELALQPGGRTLANRLVVRKFGVRVARLDETIRKLD